MKKTILVALIIAVAAILTPPGSAQAQQLTYPGYHSGISPYSHSYNALTYRNYDRYSGHNNYRGYNNYSSSRYNSSRNYGSYGGHHGSSYGNSYNSYRSPSHRSHNNHWDRNSSYHGWSR